MKNKFYKILPILICFLPIFCSPNVGSKSNLMYILALPSTEILSNIVLTSTSTTIFIGGSLQITATGTYTKSSKNITSKVSYSTSDSSIATIDSSGILTGVAAGTVTITATLNSVSGTQDVTIKSPSLTTIAISPTTYTLSVNYKITGFKAYGTYSDDSVTEITDKVIWASSSTTIASVSTTSGVTYISGVAAGSCNITATLDSISGTMSLTVQ